ncbi:LuxR C-terminal-related transcriptional regulator [Marinobacter sp.]|uniref:LuxR C-terminal-related transcriptional regulator n=1 Tax=Marinobacter sp. TaxID=50741 RepID=UPI002B266CE1|nr:LuxR C-terminal-related transcriptional regulator [Marinobacter sp.]
MGALLEPAENKRLNLVVAPAGFGKSTLISQWCAQNTTRTAWLSLDVHDDQPRQFWQYVIGAFEHSGLMGLDEAKKQLSQEAGEDLTASITCLINTLTTEATPWSLVFDDYHVISSDSIHRQLAWFIDYLPPSMLVTIASRTEPPLPLARWRVRRQVQDIYPSLLAFSEDECLSFFRETMAMDLTDQEIRDICRRTEGWVAAMQLSALSGKTGQESRGQSALAQPIALEGKLISDYVLSEVLQQLPDNLTEFLLDTSCCPRLCASLCNSIRNRTDSEDILQSLVAQNFFIIPLDNHNEWFRYHDLFREALLQRARVINFDKADTLQRHTINWLLSHGHVQEAVAQIVSSRDTTRLAQVLGEHGNNLIHGGFHLPVLEWLKYLPHEQVQRSPQLMMLKVWGLYFANRVEGLEPILSEVEDLLDKQVADSHPDAEGALAIHSELSLVRSYLARSRNDERNASDLTRQVLKDLDHNQIPLKSVTYYGLGLDYFGQGELNDAQESLNAAVRYGQVERKPSTVLSSGGLLAWIQYHRGDTHLALDTTTRIRGWVDEHYSDPSQPRLISCWQNSALTEIYRERNELELAARYLSPLLEHVENGTEPGQHVVIQYVRGHLALSEGRLDAAIEALEDALFVGNKRRDHIVFEPPAVSALLARCYLAAGDQAKAMSCIEPTIQQPANNPLHREQNQIALARTFISGGQYREAQDTLAALIPIAERNAHNRHLVEILLVYADALQHEGRSEEASAMLERALDKAEDAGFMRLFAEENDTLKRLLLNLPRLKTPGRWNRELLSMLSQQQTSHSEHPRATPPPKPKTATHASMETSSLVEPLSLREQEVLQLINQGLANKDIAVKIAVAPATVKAHIRNLYSKLGVGRRTEALAKARALELLGD